MKKRFCLWALLMVIKMNLLLGQQQIRYGSNNGGYVSILNKKVYYEEYGKGTPLLMIHGGTASIESFNKVIPKLSEQFRVIAVDTPGHGRSEQADTLSYQLLTNYFSKLIDVFKLDSLYIIGWSDGGEIALLLAADRGDKVKRVVISGAQFDHSGYTASGKRFVEQTTPDVVEKEWGNWVKNYQANMYPGNNWQAFIMEIKEMWNQDPYIPAEKVGNIKSRLLIVLGDRDMITIEHGAKMYRSIKGSEFLVLPNTTHMVFDKRSELFNAAAIEFLIRK